MTLGRRIKRSLEDRVGKSPVYREFVMYGTQKIGWVGWYEGVHPESPDHQRAHQAFLGYLEPATRASIR